MSIKRRDAPRPRPDRATSEPTTEYRVALWERPVMHGVDPDHIGWGEITYDLEGAFSVHQAIEWAEGMLRSGQGPYSGSGTPVSDQEYVLSAKVPGEDRFVQIAGCDPTVNAEPRPPYNLPRNESRDITQ